MDADQFLDELKFSKRLLPQFQNKQMVTETGSMIQTPLPFTNIRFLNPSEIDALRNRSDNYKAYRYLDLRSKNFPRLLVREYFPYDNATAKKEKKFGPPDQDEDAYYDSATQRFTTLQTPAKKNKRVPSSDTMQEETFAPFEDSVTNFGDISPVEEFSHETFPEPPTAEEETAEPTPPGEDIDETRTEIFPEQNEIDAEPAPAEAPSQAEPDQKTPADDPPQKIPPGKLLEDFLKDLKRRSQTNPQ